MSYEQSPAGLPVLPMQWDAAFGEVIGMPPPYTVVSEYAKSAQQDMLMGQDGITFAGDESGDRFAVLVTVAVSPEFEGRIGKGERTVVGCAPPDGTMASWQMGLAAPGATPGKYWAYEGRASYSAVALPLAAGGLRAWLGRLRVPFMGQQLVDKATIRGMGPGGELSHGHEGPIRGVTMDEIRRFCPDVALVEPPR
ncbi:MAG TPA: hypothetical protein VLF71_01890 [Candidatus Saccharimonadales bacterium]|nr:hypothetical protein [Candidatus Saccharimonadales bacterium]